MFRQLFREVPPLTATVTATAVNNGERQRTLADEQCVLPIVGELGRTTANVGGRSQGALKTARAQALGGSNPSPSVFRFRP